jgi:hypothetical protein
MPRKTVTATTTTTKMPRKALLISLLASTAIAAPFRHAPLPQSAIDKQKMHDIDLECGIRELAFNYSTFLLKSESQSVWDALRLTSRCNLTSPVSPASSPAYATMNPYITASYNPADYQSTFYVDAVNGNDSGNDGSLNSPFKTIRRAVRASRGAEPPSAILLRSSGTHFIGATSSSS